MPSDSMQLKDNNSEEVTQCDPSQKGYYCVKVRGVNVSVYFNQEAGGFEFEFDREVSKEEEKKIMLHFKNNAVQLVKSYMNLANGFPDDSSFI